MARNAPLVCQHLENISRQALEKYQHIIRQYVRNRHGVYALYRRNKLYYVGLATNLRTRLAHHLKDRHGHSWDRFSVYLTIVDSHLRELESLLLRTKHLVYDERGAPMKRRKLKQEKFKAQNGLCPNCSKPLPARGAVLDRLEAMSGYTTQNTRLLCPKCDARIQEERRYT
jgi:hypothetical protein